MQLIEYVEKELNIPHLQGNTYRKILGDSLSPQLDNYHQKYQRAANAGKGDPQSVMVRLETGAAANQHGGFGKQ